MTPAQRRARARHAALIQWSKTDDWTARTQPARDAFLRRFEDQVDPGRRLDPEQRAKMAERAKRAYFVKLRSMVGKKGGADAS